MKLKDNKELYEYIKSNYSKNYYILEFIFGHNYKYRKINLNDINSIKLNNIKNLSGIDELKNLKKINLIGIDDLSEILKCENIEEISIRFDKEIKDVKTLKELSKLKSIKKLKIYGKGLISIPLNEILNFSDKTVLSYNESYSFTKEQFYQIQKRLEEIKSLIKPNMKEIEKVEIVYKKLLKSDFLYDYNNHTEKSNGFMINNTLYGPLVENKGVCSGISEALEIALNYIGINAISCGGWLSSGPSAGNSHQWNQVEIENKWYNLDLTNDYDKDTWNFFMKSDDDIVWKESHYADYEDKYERVNKCTSTIYNDYLKEKQKKELSNYKETLLQTKENIKIDKKRTR